jgi:hypothetical protein
MDGCDTCSDPADPSRLRLGWVGCTDWTRIDWKEGDGMRKNIVVLAVIASLGVGIFAVSAGASAQRGGVTLAQRVTVLEKRADRQARAIGALQTENAQQQRAIKQLLAFRSNTNRWRDNIDRLTSKLRDHGTYTGPIDNSQVQVGHDPSGCEGQVARWNDTAKSLGC